MVHKPWGSFTNLSSGDGWHLKIISINPKSRLSLQSHAKRKETWVVIEGDVSSVVGGDQRQHRPGAIIQVPAGVKHRLFSRAGSKLIEISFGEFDENDIIRYEDDYDRATK